jgi:AAA domain-containing protein
MTGPDNPPPLEAETVTQLLAHAPGLVRWYIDQILPAGSVNLLIGPAMSGKSRLLYRMAVALALGKDFLGYKNMAGPAKVLYIDHEHGKDTRHRRLLEFVGKDAVIENMSVYGRPMPKIDIVKDRDRFLEFCNKYDVIILDNVLSTPGFYKDMKDNVEVTKTMDVIAATVMDRGGAFICVAHPPKGFMKDLMHLSLDETESLPEDVWTGAALGATALFALADVRMLLLSDVRNRNAHRGYKLLFVAGKSVEETLSIPLVLSKEKGLRLRDRHGPRGSTSFTAETDDGVKHESKVRTRPWQEAPK